MWMDFNLVVWHGIANMYIHSHMEILIWFVKVDHQFNLLQISGYKVSTGVHEPPDGWRIVN